jgi:multiple sugar transport system substrate-binding protein
VLTVASYTDFVDQVRGALSEWEQEHPQVRLELVALAPGDFVPAITPRLASGAGAPDVLFVDAAFLGRLGPSGVLADLSRPPHDAGALGERVLPSLAAQGRVGEAQVGIPAEAAPAVLFYRTDVLDRAGVTERDLTGSWEGFVAACARVRAGTGSYCLPRVMDLAEAVLRSDLRQGESPYFSPAGDPMPDPVRAARAIRLARAAHTAGIEASVAVGTQPWTELVRSGRIAVQLGGPTMIHRLARLDPGSSGSWRVAPLPGGGSFPTSSAFCALGARGARKELAWDLVRRTCLTRGPALAAYRAAGAVPALVEAARDAALDQPVAFLGGQVVGPSFRALAGRLQPVPVHRLDPLASDAFNLEVDHVIQDGKDIQAAIADARAEIDRRLKRQR